MSKCATNLLSPLAIAGNRKGLRFRVAFCFAVWGLTVLGATESMASCGDYLFKRGMPVTAHPASESSGEGAEVIMDRGFSPVLPTSAPCRGPNCSRGPQHPAPVPVPASISGGSDEATWLELPAFNASDLVFPLIPASERGAHFEPTKIFRPPELA